MSDGNGRNSWGVEFSLIVFADRILKSHSNVVSVHRYNDILFDVVRKSQGDTLTILCINEYSASLEVVMRALDEFPDVDIIFIGGKWNKSTREADEFCQEHRIGLFNSGELPIALRRDDYWTLELARPQPPRRRRAAR